MTDLEMTKLCAEAMGRRIEWIRGFDGAVFVYDPQDPIIQEDYDPLHDDAQVMALVKKFEIAIWLGEDHVWFTSIEVSRPPKEWEVRSSNKALNHAIVECVAKMQAAK
jgi:hypothetical protein